MSTNRQSSAFVNQGESWTTVNRCTSIKDRIHSSICYRAGDFFIQDSPFMTEFWTKIAVLHDRKMEIARLIWSGLSINDNENWKVVQHLSRCIVPQHRRKRCSLLDTKMKRSHWNRRQDDTFEMLSSFRWKIVRIQISLIHEIIAWLSILR